MQVRNQLAAWTAVVALGAASLFAQAKVNPRRADHQSRFVRVMATALNMTDAQKAQATSIFKQARESARPVRRQLMETRGSLRAAVEAGNAQQIQQLSATEGSEIGQLTAIRSSAFAQVFKTLTPDQQHKLAALQEAMHPHHHRPAAGTESD
jgi:Spy/CpxP family protein refolding chaperone